MLEKHKIGGECTHSGCVPSKTLINVAKTYHSMRTASRLGLPEMCQDTDLDFGKIMGYVDSVVQGIYANEQPKVFQDAGIDVYLNASGAQFVDPHVIQIGGETLRAEHTVVCTGSSPRVLSDMGQARVVTNETFWSLREQPDAMVFIGGGVISAEIGQVMARFGTNVTIVDRNPRILKVLDPEIGDIITQVLEEDGIRILTDADCISCGLREDGRNVIRAEQDGEETTIASRGLLFGAMGRVPNVAGLGLDRVGIEYDERHGIRTNEFLQTTAGNVYACGDVTARQKFTHTASYQAEICVDNILGAQKRRNDLSILPWAIFTDPEIAHVGLSEAEARKQHDGVQVFRVDAANVDRFITEGKTVGMLKIVMDRDNALLGADAIGAHAGEWVQMITVAMKNKLAIRSFADTIFAYPVFSEIVKKAVTRFLRTKS